MLNWLLHVERHSALCHCYFVFVLCCDSCLLIVCLHVPVQGTATPHVPVQGTATPHVPVQGTATPHVPVQGTATPHVPVQGTATLQK